MHQSVNTKLLFDMKTACEFKPWLPCTEFLVFKHVFLKQDKKALDKFALRVLENDELL